MAGEGVVDSVAPPDALSPPDRNGYRWKFEHGRRYASGEIGHYYMPNDEPEIQRLDEQHWILTQVKGGALHYAPIANQDGLHILDVGTGSGIWCMQMARDYPTAMIHGMDVSPIQPQSRPPTVEWIIQDMEAEWPYPDEYFDLVHLSLVHGCVADWREMMAKIVRHLKPGGWVEHQEFSLCRQYLVDDAGDAIPLSDRPDELPPFLRWGRLMEQAAIQRGRILQLGPELAGFHTRAGLQHVEEKVLPLKLGTWMSDPTERALGARYMHNIMSGIPGFTLAIFTKVLGWSVPDTHDFIAQITRDVRDDRLRKVIDLHVVCGQKPAAGNPPARPPPAPSPSRTGIHYSLPMGLGVLIGIALTTVPSLLRARRRW